MKKAYLINEILQPSALESVNSVLAEDGDFILQDWPDSTYSLPDDIDLAIYVIEEANSEVEEARTLSCVNSSIRIVCLYLQKMEQVSDIARQYCSSRVSVGSVGLAGALRGDDYVQESSDGSEAPKSDEKHNKC